MNWIRIFNRLFEIINPNDTSHPNYFSGSRFIEFVREIDPYFPTYSQFIEQRNNERLSTSRRDYYYDILLGFDEEASRIEIVKSIIDVCDKIDSERIDNLKKEMGIIETKVPAYIEELKEESKKTEEFKHKSQEKLKTILEYKNKRKPEVQQNKIMDDDERGPVVFPASPIKPKIWYKQPQYFVPLLVAIIAGVFGIINILIPWYLNREDSAEIEKSVLNDNRLIQITRGHVYLIKELNVAIELDADENFKNNLVKIWLFYPIDPNIELTEDNRLDVSTYKVYNIKLNELTNIYDSNIGTLEVFMKEPVFDKKIIKSIKVGIQKKTLPNTK
ncbi:MAG: hypothetical protein K8R79_06440 [Calditrichales bacterium]|nr:hypothetical protein [Calditrichales bacterium]